MQGLQRLGISLLASYYEGSRANAWPALSGKRTAPACGLPSVKGGAEKAVNTVRSWVGRRAGSSQKVLVKSCEVGFHERNFPDQPRHRPARSCSSFPDGTWGHRQPTRLQFGERVWQLHL